MSDIAGENNSCDGASVPIINATAKFESSEDVVSNVPASVEGETQTVEITYGNKVFTCKACNETGSGTRFQEHLMKHLLLQPYKCLHCSECFSGRSEIGFHMQNKHSGKEKKSALRANKRATVILNEAKKKGSFSFKSNLVYNSMLENEVLSSHTNLSSNSNRNDTEKCSGSNVTLSRTEPEEFLLSKTEQHEVVELSNIQSENHLVLTGKDSLSSRTVEKTESETHDKNMPNTKSQNSDLHVTNQTKQLNRKSEIISILLTENDILESNATSESLVGRNKEVLSLGTERVKSKSQHLHVMDTTKIFNEKSETNSVLHREDCVADSCTKSGSLVSKDEVLLPDEERVLSEKTSSTLLEQDKDSPSLDISVNKPNEISNSCEKDMSVTKYDASKEPVTHEQDGTTDKVTNCQDTCLLEESIKSNNLHKKEDNYHDHLATKPYSFKECDDPCKSGSLQNTKSKKTDNVSFMESKFTENSTHSQSVVMCTNNENIVKNFQSLNTSPKSTKNILPESIQQIKSPVQSSATKPFSCMLSCSKMGSLNVTTVSTIQQQSSSSNVLPSQQIVEFVKPNIIIPPVALTNNLSPVHGVNTATSLLPVDVTNSQPTLRSYFIVPISLPPTMTLTPCSYIYQNAIPIMGQGNVIPAVLPQTQISPNFKQPTTSTQRIIIKHKMPSNTGSDVSPSTPYQLNTPMKVSSPVKIIPRSHLQYPLDSSNVRPITMGDSSQHKSKEMTKTKESCQTKEKPEPEYTFVSENVEETVDGIMFKETATDEKKRSNIFIALIGDEYFCGKCRLRWKKNKKESFWFHLWNHQHLGGIFCDKCVRTNGPAGELTCSWTDSFIEQLQRMNTKNNTENMNFNMVKTRVTSVVRSPKGKLSGEMDEKKTEMENTACLTAHGNRTSHSVDKNKASFFNEESKTYHTEVKKECSDSAQKIDCIKDAADDYPNEIGLKILECKSLDIEEFDGINSDAECSSRSMDMVKSISELQNDQHEKEIDQNPVLFKKVVSDSDNTNQEKSIMCLKHNDNIDALISEVQNLPSETVDSCEDKEIENYLVNVQDKEVSYLNNVEKTSNDGDTLQDSCPLRDYSSDIFNHIQAPAYHFYVCGGMCSFSCLLPGDFKQHLLICKYMQSGSFTCFHCGFVGDTVEVLMKHVHKHAACHKSISAKPPSAIFLCSIKNCKFSTNILNAFYGHFCQVHPNLSSYTCTNCEQVYPTVQDLANHLKENLLSVVSCKHCMAKDVDKQIVMEHILFEHPGKGKMLNTVKQLLCKERKLHQYYACQNSLNVINAPTDVTNANKQTVTGSGDPVLKSVCGSNMQNHSQKPKINENKKNRRNSSGDCFCCHICSYIANDSSELDDHLACHAHTQSEDDMLCFVCPACPMQVNTLKEFEIHAACHEENVSFWLYECGHDDYQTSQGTMMLKHIRKENHPCESEVDLLHAEEKYITSKVIKCACCKFKTTRVACLDEHMKGHTIITSKAPAVRVAAHSTTDVVATSESTTADRLHLKKQKAGTRQKRVRSHSKDEGRSVPKKVTKRRFFSDTDASKIHNSMKDEVVFIVPSNSVFQKDVACPLCSYRAFFKNNLLKHIAENHPMVIVKESSQSECLDLDKSNKSLSESRTSNENYDTVDDSEPDKSDDMKIGSQLLDVELAPFYKTSENLLVCKLCEKLCSNKKLVHHHILDHLKLNLWQCTSCDFQDNRRFIIINHAKNVHGTDYGVAPVKDFLKKLSEHKHKKKTPQKKVQGTLILDNPLCSDEMSQKLKVLYRHEDWCYECVVCKMKYNTLISIHKHLLQNHLKIALVGCGLCWFEGLEEHNVLEHMCDKHSGKPANVLHLNVDIGASVKKFIESCPKSLFPKKKKLMLGNDDMDSYLNCLYEVNRRMKLVCLICKDELSTKYSAHRHLLAHLGVDLVGCSSCEFKTLSDRDIIEHMKLSHAGIQLKIDYLDVDIAEAVRDFFDKSCKTTTSKENKSKEGTPKKRAVEKSKATGSTSRVEKPSKVPSSPGLKSGVKKKIVGGLVKYKCRFCEYLALSERSVCAHILKSHSKSEDNLFKCSKCSFQVESLVEISSHMFEKHPGVLGHGFYAVNNNTSAISQNDDDVANTHSLIHKHVKETQVSSTNDRFSSDVFTSDNEKTTKTEIVPTDKAIYSSADNSRSVNEKCIDVQVNRASSNASTDCSVRSNESAVCSMDKDVAFSLQLRVSSSVDIGTKNIDESFEEHRINNESVNSNSISGEEMLDAIKADNEKKTVTCDLVDNGQNSITKTNIDDKITDPCMYDDISDNETTDSVKEASKKKTIACDSGVGNYGTSKDKSNINDKTIDPCMYDDISDDETANSVKEASEKKTIACDSIVGNGGTSKHQSNTDNKITDPSMYEDISDDEITDSLKQNKKRKICSNDVGDTLKRKVKSDKTYKRKRLDPLADINDRKHVEPNLVEKQNNKNKIRSSKSDGLCSINPEPQKTVESTTTKKKDLDTIFQCTKCSFTTKNEEKSFSSHLKNKHGILKYVQCGYCSARYIDTKSVKSHMHFFHKDRRNTYKLLQLSLLFKEQPQTIVNNSVNGTSEDEIKSISSQIKTAEILPLKNKSIKVSKPKENTCTLIKKLKDSSSSLKVKESDDSSKSKGSLQKSIGKRKKKHKTESKNDIESDHTTVSSDRSSKVILCSNKKESKRKLSPKKDGQVSKKDEKQFKQSSVTVKEEVTSSTDYQESKGKTKNKTNTSPMKGKVSSSVKNEVVQNDKKVKTDKGLHSKYRCKYCSFEDNDTAKTRQHLYDHWHYKPYKCSFCLQGFTCSEKRALHAKDAHENILTFCRFKRNEETEICANKMLKVFEQIAKREFAKSKKINITHCDQEDKKSEDHLSKEKQKLADNKSTEHLSKKSKTDLNCEDGEHFKCYHCNKTALSLQSLRIHFGKKHGDVKKKSRFWIDVKTGQLCNMSGAVFDDVNKTVTYSQSFLCGYCSMRSSKRSGVADHQHFSHATQIGFIVNLNNAQIVGHSVSDSSCPSTPDHCAEPMAKRIKLTKTPSPMKSSSSTSQSPIRYSCNQCPYNETSLYSYRRHLASHGTFRYLCSDMSQTCALKCGCCGYVASDSSDFSSHVSSHLTGERTYKCGYCTYDSFKRCGVLIHLQSAHHGKKLKIIDLRKARARAVATSTRSLVNVEPVVRIKDIMGVPAAEFGDLLLEHGVSTIDLSYIEDDKILQILKLFGSAIPDDQLYELLNE